MKIVIDISEDIYNDVKTQNGFNWFDVCKVKDSIKNGIPLEEELVAELLDLKAEIDIYEAPIYDQPYCRGLKKAMEFIDKHISELKRREQWINGKN